LIPKINKNSSDPLRMSLTAIKNLMGDENVEITNIDGSANDIILQEKGTVLNFGSLC